MKILQNIFKPKWKHNDVSIRKQALVSLDVSQNQAIFTEIVNSDPSAEIRVIALKRITDLDTIEQACLGENIDEVKDVATRILSNMLALAESIEEGIAIERINQLENQKIIEFVAEKGATKPIRMAALEKVNRESVLGNLAINDEDPQIRETAASRLQQKSTLERVYKATKTKDKRTSRTVKDKLDKIIEAEQRPAILLQEQKQVCVQIEALGNKGLWDRDKISFDKLVQQWQSISETNAEFEQRFEKAKTSFEIGYEEYLKRQQERLQVEASFIPLREEKQKIVEKMITLQNKLNSALAEQDLKALQDELDDNVTSWDKLAVLPDDLESELKATFDGLVKDITKKIQVRLNEVDVLSFLVKIKNEITPYFKKPHSLSRNVLDNLQARVPQILSHSSEEATVLRNEIKQNLVKLENKFDEHNKYIKKIRKQVETELNSMEQSLEKGLLKEATQFRNKVQKLLDQLEKSRVSGLNELSLRLNAGSSEINRLHNWRSWANTPQKERLIAQVEALIDSNDDPKEIAFLISQARNEWQKLGPSERGSSQELWDKFKEVCDKAYEPCKSYFEQESQVRSQNYQKRIEFLEDFEKFVNNADWQNMDWRKVENLFRHVRKEWQDLGLTDKEKRKELNNRFYNTYEILKTNLNKEWDKNLENKKSIIEAAKELVAIENLSDAISKAKQLQSNWKTAGRVQQSKERELWTEFKDLTDEVFNRRKIMNKEKEQAHKELLKSRILTCEKIEDICNKPLKELSPLKSDLEKLKSEFQSLSVEASITAKDKISQRVADALHVYERKLDSLSKVEIIDELHKLKAKADLCEKLENMILQGEKEKAQAVFDELKEIGKIGKSDWEAKIARRVSYLENAFSETDLPKPLTELEKDNLEQKNFATAELEIIAEVETPADSANDRLKIQMQRLSDKLQHHSTESRWESFLSAEVNWLTTGFIPVDELESINRRHVVALQALRNEYPDELESYV